MLINGTSGDDGLIGTAGDDTINGFGGNDNLEGRGGNDVLDGGAGAFDYAVYTGATSGVIVNLSISGMQSVGGGQGEDALSGIEGLIGSAHNDTLVGDAGDNHFNGGAGDDLIDGAGGTDRVTYWGATGALTVDLGHSGPQAVGGGQGTDTLVSIERVEGGAFGDLLIGTNAGSEGLAGGGGNDTLQGGGGDWDDLIGGTGDDLLDGGAGSGDTVGYYGAAGAVRVDLNVQGVGQTIGGGEGVDTLVGVEGVHGSAHNDTLIGTAGDNYLEGREGDDRLEGGGGADHADYYSATSGVRVDLTLQGTAQAVGGGLGVDTLFGIENLGGSFHSDTLVGDAGMNHFNPREGDDLVDGGAGWDGVHYGDASGGVLVDLAAPGPNVSGPSGADTLLNIEFIHGSQHNDTIRGSDANEGFEGAAGDDVLDGRGGWDNASYWSASSGVRVDLAVTGAQSVGAGLGADTLLNIESLVGSNFSDTLSGDAANNGFEGRQGDDVIDGRGGIDSVGFWNASGAIVVDLALSGAQSIGADQGSDTLINIENVDGGAFSDQIFGNAAGNYLNGHAGNDTISGREGADNIDGEAGDDWLDGGAGQDNVTYWGASGSVIVNLSTGQASGAAGNDVLSGFENVGGSQHADQITGDGGANFLNGEGGADTLSGLGGADGLFGNTGDDSLSGGAGNDDLQGSAGNDVLDGGADTDTASYFGAAGGVTANLSISGPQTIGGGEGVDTLVNIENLSGGQHADALTGNAATNFINGQAGADSIQGAGGDDNLMGGAGDDVIDGGSGFDVGLYGDAASGVTVSLAITGAQAVGGGRGVDTLIGLEGLAGSNHNDVLGGDAGINYLGGNLGDDTLQGLGGADNLFGGLGADRLEGGADDDFLRGEAGNDTLQGGDGDDFLVGAAGNDLFEGGAGFDRVSFFGTAPGVSVNLALAGPQDTGAGFDSFVGVEHVSGTLGSDTLVGDAQANWLWGSGGGNDVLGGAGGDDLLMVGRGDHVLAGGDGIDTVALPIATDVTGGVAISLELQGAAQATGQGAMTLTGIENLSGTVHADTLAGDSGANVLAGYEGSDLLAGGAGNDVLLGDGAIDILGAGTGSGAIHTYLDLNDYEDAAHGADTLQGGDGDDQLRGGGGNDRLEGGAGTDRAVFSGAFADYSVETLANGEIKVTDLRAGAPDGSDTLSGVEVLGFSDGERPAGPPPSQGADILGTNKADTLTGTSAGERVFGDNGDDQVRAGGGDDTLQGGNGQDSLSGEGGADVLDGGNAKDVLNGGSGNDTLTGGNGNDVFVFSAGADRITDFDTKNDQLDVSGLFASFSAVQAAASQDGADVVIVHGADSIRLVGVSLSSLSGDDFLF